MSTSAEEFLVGELSDKQLELLERDYTEMSNLLTMLLCRPFKFNWDVDNVTASTDCKEEVNANPWFFLNGQRRVGKGIVCHESGHIRFSPNGVELMEQAYRQGGATRRHIMNLILDRKDDWLGVKKSPGIAKVLLERMCYIATMTRRSAMRDHLVKLGREGVSEEEITKLLKNWKPSDAMEDFFFAAKWHKKPRTAKADRAMKYMTRGQLIGASEPRLLYLAEKVHKVLGDMPKQERSKQEQRFNQLMLVAIGLENGADGSGRKPRYSKSANKQIAQILRLVAGKGRQDQLQRLVALLKRPMSHPGPMSVGVHSRVRVVDVPAHTKYNRAYDLYLADVRDKVDVVVKAMKKIDSPSKYTLRGQEKGKLDLKRSARIALGLPRVYKRDVLIRKVSLAAALVIDNSYSMNGQKLEKAKRLAVTFCEAIDALGERQAEKTVWAYNSSSIQNFGSSSRGSAFVGIEVAGGNSDTHMLRVVGAHLSKSKFKRRIMFVLCDDGPDSIEQAGKLALELKNRGILVINLMVDVHGSPNIYPIQLLFSTIDECLDQFGEIIQLVVANIC